MNLNSWTKMNKNPLKFSEKMEISTADEDYLILSKSSRTAKKLSLKWDYKSIRQIFFFSPNERMFGAQ